MAETANENMTDENLMELVKTGDHQAFSELVTRHTQKFFNLAYRTLGNERDAEDVVQDSFVKIWRKPSLYKPERGAKFTTWFYRVVFNASIDMKRKTKRDLPLIMDVPEEDDARQDKRFMAKQSQAKLEEAINSLPERQQAALNLCYYQNIPQKEAAEIMGVGLKALESLLSRGKAGLKDYFARESLQEIDYATFQ
ncbi:MAG: RNA polymerase sigma-70 factor [Alphaproteobacteria bacterium]|nr:RNA polymerase sigma-70 factor [Alphaproteobacteria bacterium]